jgi:hypothetical protein
LPQKRREPKSTGLDRITIMLPADIKSRLDAEVVQGTNTFSDVVRDYLRRGLAAEGPDDGLPPTAQALGNMVALLADGCLAVADTRAEAIGMIQVAAPSILAEWKGAKLSPEAKQLAGVLAKRLIDKVRTVKATDGPNANYISDVQDGSTATRRRAQRFLQVQPEFLKG